MLETERDADYGQAADDSEPYMQQGDFDAAEDDPDDVHCNGKTAGVVRSGGHFMSERPEGESCYLEQLQSEWNADDGDAEQKSHQGIIETYYEASQQKP